MRYTHAASFLTSFTIIVVFRSPTSNARGNDSVCANLKLSFAKMAVENLFVVVDAGWGDGSLSAFEES